MSGSGRTPNLGSNSGMLIPSHESNLFYFIITVNGKEKRGLYSLNGLTTTGEKIPQRCVCAMASKASTRDNGPRTSDIA